MSDGLTFWLVNIATYLRHPINIARFRLQVGYFPNVAVPRRYNEKMLWRKVFDHNPQFTIFADKLATKRFQAERRPGLRVLPVLWKGRDASEIPQESLLKPFAIKASHAPGRDFFATPGVGTQRLPVDAINDWLRTTYGRGKLERAYRHAEKAIFVEEQIVAACNSPLVDISIHATDRRCLFIEAIINNRSDDRQKAYFRPDGTRWHAIEKKRATGDGNQPLPNDFRLPATYVEALEHAHHLSLGVDYARFDFLSRADQLYGGEITVYPGSGLTRHTQFIDYNAFLADQWDLSKSWFLNTPQRRIAGVYADALRRLLDRETKPGETSS